MSFRHLSANISSAERGRPRIPRSRARLLLLRLVLSFDRQHARHILHDECSGPPLSHGIDESPKQLVARVTRKALVVETVELGTPDDGKSLAQGVPDDNVGRARTTEDLGMPHLLEVKIIPGHHD